MKMTRGVKKSASSNANINNSGVITLKSAGASGTIGNASGKCVNRFKPIKSERRAFEKRGEGKKKREKPWQLKSDEARSRRGWELSSSRLPTRRHHRQKLGS